LDEAIAQFRDALRLKPDDPTARIELGTALKNNGQLDQAIAEYREALRVKPDDALAHYNLAIALRAQGRLEEAIAECREALRIKKDYPRALCFLGHALCDQGRFADALAAMKQGHELGARNPRWAYPSAEWVVQCQRLLELDQRLPAILSGQEQPADVAERMALAKLCQLRCKERYATAARFYGEAFAAQPNLAGDQPSLDRYDAACCAALAGCGRGEEATWLDADERGRLRRRALDWLRADLQAWRKALERDRSNASEVRQQMRHWLGDADFAGVRGDALAKLPEAERPAWQQLWADVTQTLAGTEGTAVPEKNPTPK
jgi:tetratricopeptide (TPR) repeat protein